MAIPVRLVAPSLALAAASATAAAQPAEPSAPVEDQALSDAITAELPSDPCLGTGVLVGAVSALLRTDRVAADLSVDVRDRDGGVSFRVVRGGTTAVRRFDVLPEGCEARRDAVALAVALAIDHTVLDRIRESGDVPAAPEEPADASSRDRRSVEPGGGSSEARGPPAGAASSEPESAGAPEGEGPDLGADLGLGAALLWRVLVDPVGAGTVSLELAVGPVVRIRLGALLTTAAHASLGPGQWRSQLLAGWLGVCLGGPIGPLRAGGCGALAAGPLVSEGSGFLQDLEASDPWGAALGGVFARWPGTGPIALRLSVDGSVALLRPTVHAQSRTGDVLAESSLPAVGLVASLELRVGVR